MRRAFVKTSNFQAFATGLTAVEERGAMEASMLLVTGEAGFGKSEIVDQWAVQTNAAYLRAKVQWTPHYFMHELADLLKVDARGRAKDLFARIAAVMGGQEVSLVIDEVEHTLRNNCEVLEQIRDLSDLTEQIVVLVGMEQVHARIARFPQISGRIATVVNFHPATVRDVRLTCDTIAEIGIENDLVEEIHRQSAGRMREILNAISKVERMAKLEGKKRMRLADVIGRTLTHDWKARRPRLVKAPPTEPPIA